MLALSITRPVKSLGTVSSNPQFDMSAVLVTKKRLVIDKRPSFISHLNGILLRVLKKSYTPALLETKKIPGSRFICHPNGIVLKVLNQKRSRKSLFRAVVSARFGTVLHLHRSTSLLSPSAAAVVAAALMLKMEMETQTNCDCCCYSKL